MAFKQVFVDGIDVGQLIAERHKNNERIQGATEKVHQAILECMQLSNEASFDLSSEGTMNAAHSIYRLLTGVCAALAVEMPSYFDKGIQLPEGW